jgi:DNA-directed RNA polymerase subunit F
MVKPELVDETAITLAEARAELEKVKARDEQLNFRGGKCEEYLNDFTILSAPKAKQLREKISKLGISRLKSEHEIMIADLLPQTVDDVKVVFQGGTVSISKKDMERIASLVKEVV